MGKEIDRRGNLDPAISNALRELAGWPTQGAEEGGFQYRNRQRTVHYDASGNVVGSTETYFEEEFRTHWQSWGK